MSSYPPNYFEMLAAVEDEHWWHRGMRSIAAALLADRVERGGAMLDAGCGTGGFLAWASSRGFSPLAGIDISPDAVAATRGRLPAGTPVEVAPIWALPFDHGSFSVVACNDVLQHVDEDRVGTAVEELRRVLQPDGALLVRTNGGWRPRRERADWRVYDRRGLREVLEAGGFRCQRLSFVNTAGSLVARARGLALRAPNATTHGLPPSSGGRSRLRYGTLRVEAELLRVPRISLPYGHTLVALAVPAPDRGRS